MIKNTRSFLVSSRRLLRFLLLLLIFGIADIGAVREEGGFGDNWLHWIQGNMTIECVLLFHSGLSATDEEQRAIDPDGKDIAGRLTGGDSSRK